MTVLADELSLDLGTIAEENMQFNFRRWPQSAEELAELPPELDAQFPEDKRLPEEIYANFETHEIDGLKKTVVKIYPQWPLLTGHKQFGDPIDDNSPAEDGYRYHDIFHFSYVVFLGWSPVVRKLMGRKRKPREGVAADLNIDRIEDGARAGDTEEAVTSFIYSYVSLQDFLKTSTNIDTGLLTAVRTLVRNLEVNVRYEKEWEVAIIEAAKVLRSLQSNGGGWVVASRKERRLSYLGLDQPNSGTGGSR